MNIPKRRGPVRRAAARVRAFARRHEPDWWRYLPNRDRYAILNASIAIVWASVFGLFTPAALSDVVTRPITLLFVAYIIIGGGLVIFGRIRHKHTIHELSGLSLLIAGMMFYFVVQFSLGVLAGNADRYALAVLAFWITSTFFERYDELLRHFIPIVREWLGEVREDRRNARARRRALAGR